VKRPAMRTLLAWIALGVAACGSIELAGPNPSVAPAPAVAGTGAARIAQSGFGRDARFALCQPPACPRPSAKSLPAPASAPVAVEPSPARTPPAQDALALTPMVSRRSPPVSASEVIEDPSPLNIVVHFGFGRSDLDAAGRDALDLAAAQPLPVRRVLIAGRTDSIGPRCSESGSGAGPRRSGAALPDGTALARAGCRRSPRAVARCVLLRRRQRQRVGPGSQPACRGHLRT
jgi:peptidoglycan-binding protein ArfA